MIEVELLNIMKKIIADGGDIKPFCEKLIYIVQRQYMAIAGVKVGIETREQISQATLDLVQFMKAQLVPKVPPSEATIELSAPDKAP